MDNLPLELYQAIFEFINFNDLLNARLTCKKFNEAIKHFHVNELCFISLKKRRTFWNYANKPANNLYSINDHSKLFTLNNSLFNVQFLRRLKIDDYGSGAIKLSLINLINKLEHLIELEITLYLEDEHSILSLPKLKALSIFVCRRSRNQFLQLNTSRLEFVKLQCYQLESIIKFSQPSSIEHLSVEKLNENFIENTLALFQNLKSIFINCKHEEIGELLIQKSSLEKREIKVYFKNVQLLEDDFNQEFISGNVFLVNLDNLNHDRQLLPNFKKIMQNYERLVNCHNFQMLNYSKQAKQMKSDLIPSNFFGKFFNIQIMHVRGAVKDEYHLTNFIKNCHNLYELKLSKSLLTNTFYSALPAISSLDNLFIYEDRKKIHFESFIFKLHFLKDLRTNKELHENVIEKLNAFGYLNHLEFKINKIPIIVNVLKVLEFKKYRVVELNSPQPYLNGCDFDEFVTWFKDFKKRTFLKKETIKTNQDNEKLIDNFFLI